MTNEELLNTPYWIIDILPMQVSKDSKGQFFAVEKYMLNEQMNSIKQKHINLVLKLNCYMDISIDDEVNPDPGKIVTAMKGKTTFIRLNDSMILSEPDDIYMTVFNPDDKLLELIKTLSAGEGLYVWNT